MSEPLGRAETGCAPLSPPPFPVLVLTSKHHSVFVFAFACIHAPMEGRRTSDLLKLELLTVVNHLMWVLRTELKTLTIQLFL